MELEHQELIPTYNGIFHGEYKDVRLANRIVVCAACRIGKITLAGARHFDMTMHSQLEAMNIPRDEIGNTEQGFIDQFGVFMTREEAFILATAKGQLKDSPNVPNVLFSEDLY